MEQRVSSAEAQRLALIEVAMTVQSLHLALALGDLLDVVLRRTTEEAGAWPRSSWFAAPFQ
ncbi:MAG: hypothetical protein ABI193_18815 [Minicystis sp.]